MRGVAILSILGLVAAGHSPGDCLVDSGEAVSDVLDATLFMWAASKRCGKGGEHVKCAVDVSSAIKSVNSMVNVILKTLSKCKALHIANKDCGMSVGILTEHTSALAASGAQIAQKCPKNPPAAAGALGAAAGPVMCTVDLKNTAKSMFKSIRELMHIKKNCEDKDSRKCVMNALDVAYALSGFGDFLAGAVGQCARTSAFGGGAAAANKLNTRASLCAQGALDLIHHASKVSSAGIELSRKCSAMPARLFQQFDDEDDNKDEKRNSLSTTLVLGAFLPLSAIVGFVGGRFYASHRSRTEQVRSFMSDTE